MDRILLTHPLNRKTFDIYNIIKSKYSYLRPIVTVPNVSILQRIFLKYIYAGKIFSLEHNEYEDFEKNLKSILEKFPKDRIIFLPIEEDGTLLFYKFIINNKYNNLYFNLPSYESFLLSCNKKEFAKFCLMQGFSIPNIFDREDISTLRTNFIPLIIKPIHGDGALGFKYINNPNDLKLLDFIQIENYVIQENVTDGSKVRGGFYLFHKGKFIDYYGHKRIRTYPINGGVTVLSALENNHEIKEMGKKVLERLNWSGFAMLEFLYDPRDGEYKIIELNPRIWGSFLLSEFAKTNFFINYVNTALDMPILSAEVGENKYIRWVFPMDFMIYMQSKFKIKDFWKLDIKKTCYVNFTYSSPERSALFLLASIFNLQNIVKLFKKIVVSAKVREE